MKELKAGQVVPEVTRCRVGRPRGRLERAAADLPEQIDHVMITAVGPTFR
jgi:hypothetical protein